MPNLDDVLDDAIHELNLADQETGNGVVASPTDSPRLDLLELDWRWVQSSTQLTLYITLPESLVNISCSEIFLELRQDALTLDIHDIRAITWFLFAEATKTDHPIALQKLPQRAVIVVKLQKQVEAWWPSLLNHSLPFTPELFLPEEELEIKRQAEIAAHPAAFEDPAAEHGLRLVPQEEVETEADRRCTSEDLHGQALNLLQRCTKAGDYGPQWAECARLFRVLALHRRHGPARVALQNWIYECDPTAPPHSRNPLRAPRTGFWFLAHAAAEGDRPAQTSLGMWHEQGLPPLPCPSFALAVRWYQRAAQAGCCQAMCALAHLLRSTEGDPRYGGMAEGLLREALLRGSPDAHKTYSIWHLEGTGGWPIDLQKAEQRMRAARLIYPEIPDLPVAKLEEAKRQKMGPPVPESINPIPSVQGGLITPESAPAPPSSNGAATPSFGLAFWERAATVALGAAVLFWVRSAARRR